MLGERLKKLRGKRTQEEVAKYIGVSRARYSHYENGRSEPDTETLKKIASYYNVTTDYLLGLEKKEEKARYRVSNEHNKYDEQSELLLTSEELKVLQEIKKHPILFHDLANAPEKKIKQLIKMWEFVKKDLESDDHEEGFGDIED